MAVDSYTTLLSSIDDWSERSFATSLKETFIQLFESAANRRLGADYRRTTSATVTTNSSGEAGLPAGYVAMRSLTQDLLGSTPLRQVSWPGLIGLNPYADSDTAQYYAIHGSTIRVAPVCEDDFTAIYDAKLTALTSSNASNWLLTESPNAYLWGCLAAAEAYNKNFGEAAAWEAKAMQAIDELVAESHVGQYGAAEMTLDFVTP